jgi:cytochrome c oxidase subunit 1/cytochrome c oxidase subunit I+III
VTSVEYTREPRIAASPDADLEAIWRTKPGFIGWLSSVDHKEIGKRYIVTAFLFLVLGGIEALVMRLQLARPNQSLLTPQEYNQLFTVHGITVIFLYAAPVLSGFSNYLFPLILGSRDMAFPRLNAFSYWSYLAAGLFLYASFIAGFAPDDGWFNYVPYASKPYSPGPNMDVYALGMILLSISTTVGAANFVVTVFRTRAPGMSINRLPIIIWGTLTVSVGNLFAVPSVTLAFVLLWTDRNLGTHFYTIDTGGQPLLWQHLFWMFAHPWVYVVVLPAMGMVSDGLPVFCRRPLVGYTAVALSTVLTMFLGFGVWLHHMFATGLPFLALSFFSAASLIITIPSAVAVFSWIATIWTGRPVFTTAFLYFASFIVTFTIGGLSGVMTAMVPIDLQLTDTYFIVAHLHYVLIGINLFGVLGGLFYWFPKMTGRMLGERLGKWGFWTVFIGFNVTFFPMHFTGLMGMPRRVYTYPSNLGWDVLNMITSLGSLVLAIGVLLVVINVVVSRVRGRAAGPNPWDAPTLEWSVSSPPPPYNFAIIPTVASRHPLWEDRLDEGMGNSVLDEGPVLTRGKEALGVSALDAEPDIILKMPEDTLLPLLLTIALTVGFAGLLFVDWTVAGLATLAVAALIAAWLWPRRRLGQRAENDHAA